MHKCYYAKSYQKPKYDKRLKEMPRMEKLSNKNK